MVGKNIYKTCSLALKNRLVLAYDHTLPPSKAVAHNRTNTRLPQEACLGCTWIFICNEETYRHPLCHRSVIFWNRVLKKLLYYLWYCEILDQTSYLTETRGVDLYNPPTWKSGLERSYWFLIIMLESGKRLHQHSPPAYRRLFLNLRVFEVMLKRWSQNGQWPFGLLTNDTLYGINGLRL